MENNSLVTGSPTLPYLPNEIMREIISYFDSSNVLDANPDAKQHELIQTSDLTNLCLASKRLQSIAGPLLYKVVFANPGNIEHLSRTLSNRPDLAQQVQRVFIDISAGGRLPGVEGPTMGLFSQGHAQSHRGMTRMRRMDAQRHAMSFTPLILRQTPNIRVLDLFLGRDLSTRMGNTWTMLPPVLNDLRELRVDIPTFENCHFNLSCLLDRAPNLSTLCVAQDVVHRNIHEISMKYKSVKNIKFKSQAQGSFALGNFLHAFPRAVNISYQNDDTQDLFYFQTSAADILNELREAKQRLKVLHLIWPSPFPMYTNYDPGEDSLKDFVCLEELTIPTAALVSDGDPVLTAVLTATNILKNLPPSIRRLQIYKESNVIDSQLLELAEARSSGRYPNLEELVLQIPPPRMEEQARVPGLREACLRSGIRFSVVPFAMSPSQIEDYVRHSIHADDPPPRTTRRMIIS